MTIDDLIKAAGRELGMREVVYPHRVQDGNMKPETAKHETDAMSAIVALLKTVRSDQRITDRLIADGIITAPAQAELF